MRNNIAGLRCGRDFAIARLALGVGLRVVAEPLGVVPATLLSWEKTTKPIEIYRRKRWMNALEKATRSRAQEISQQGFTMEEVTTQGYETVLTLLQEIMKNDK